MTVAAFAEPFIGSGGGLPYTLPFTVGVGGVGNHDDFTVWARELREYRIERAYDRPHIRLYDGDWVFRGTVYGEISGNIGQEVNETGLMKLVLPIDLDDPR